MMKFNNLFIKFNEMTIGVNEVLQKIKDISSSHHLRALIPDIVD